MSYEKSFWKLFWLGIKIFKNSGKKRFELRKTYAHYDEKMEKWVKEKNIKFNKGKEESESDIQKFENNEKNIEKQL